MINLGVTVFTAVPLVGDNPLIGYHEVAGAPGVNDDEDVGYNISYTWKDTNTNIRYVLIDKTAGAAVWKERAGDRTVFEARTVELFNDSGDPASFGDGMAPSTTADLQIIRQSGNFLRSSLNVAEGGADQTNIRVWGHLRLLESTGAVNRRDFLRASTTANKYDPTTSNVTGVYGMALEQTGGAGIVTCIAFEREVF